MKGIFIVLVGIVFSVLLVMCKKKEDTPKNNATCTTCSDIPMAHNPDAGGVWYYVPTAYTPNGDGRNDVFRVLYDKLDTASSTITIWDMNGTEVFKGRITERWEGVDLKGKKCAAGKYPVYLQLNDVKGNAVKSCACVHLLQYTGSCLATGSATYYFEDQVEAAKGFTFTTNETLCP